jgi:ubiquinone/menaquinone biosynthesis C-methylase UbiE
MPGMPLPPAPPPGDIWSAGDYADVCERMIPTLGTHLVELAGVRDGEEVLDVAAGTGNAALPAARRGAAVTALDVTPALLEAGAERAAAAGLEVTWVHGDAQDLPFAAASFDRVLSCVGVQFCADRAAAAAELLRVCRPGGRVALIAWTPEGFIGQVLAAVSRARGAAGPSPLEWGREGVVEEIFGDGGEVTTSRAHVEMAAESAAAWVDYMAAAYGPLLMARRALRDRGTWDSLRGELCAIAARYDRGGEGAFAAPAEYLCALIDP